MIYENAQIATMSGERPYGLIPQGAVVVHQSRIAWIGPQDALAGSGHSGPSIDLEGRLITPALIDCHTHIVHGGHRAGEFAQRLSGASYSEIAQQGGGILSTVKATRAASEDALLTGALRRVDALIAEGAALIEVKSGYGLTLEDELKMLRVARRIEAERPIRVVTSFLGAHATSPEYHGRADAYIDEVCLPALAAAHEAGLVDAVDGFCETIAFDTAQIGRVFDAARALGLPVKLHAEQLSHSGAAALAARFGALSVDHIEYATPADAAELARSGTVAVLLPGAFYTLRETQKPPVDALRRHGVPIALATDCNPGSSPMTSLLLAMNMGCTLFGLTPQEALAGVTCNAARALGRGDCGRLVAGLRADMAIWDVEGPEELGYRIGFNPLHARVFGGAP